MQPQAQELIKKLTNYREGSMLTWALLSMQPGKPRVGKSGSNLSSPKCRWDKAQGIMRLEEKETGVERRKRDCLLITKLILTQVIPKTWKTKTIQSTHSTGRLRKF